MGAAVEGSLILLLTLIVIYRVENYRQNFASPRAIAEEEEDMAFFRRAKSMPTPDADRIPSATVTSQRIVSDGRTVSNIPRLEALHESTTDDGSTFAWAGPKHGHARGHVRPARTSRRTVDRHAAGRHRLVGNLQ